MSSRRPLLALLAGALAIAPRAAHAQPPTTMPAAVSETEAPPPPPPRPPPTSDATASLTPEDGLVLTAPSNIAQLRLGTVIVVRGSIVHTETDDLSGSFALRNMRLHMSGHVAAEWLQYFVQVEFSNPRLLDGYLRIAPTPIFQVTVGQFLQPFGFEWEPNPAQYLMPETSPAGTFFALGRDAGAMVSGRTDDHFFSYWATATLGNPVTLSNDTNVRDAVGLGRVQLQPVGDVPADEAPYADGDVEPALAIGLDGYGGNIVRSDSRYDSITANFNTTAVGRFTEGVGSTDVRFVAGPVSAAAQLDVGWRRPLDTPGAVGAWGLTAMAQAGVFVWGHILELAARGSYLDPDFSLPDDLFATGELMLALYPIGMHAAATLRYGVAHQDATGFPITSLGREWIHLGTLQLQAYL